LRLTVLDSLSKKPVRLLLKLPTAIDEFGAQLRELIDTVVQGIQKMDPRAQHVRRVVGRALNQLRQIRRSRTLGLQLARTPFEGGRDLIRDVWGPFHCTVDVRHNSLDLA